MILATFSLDFKVSKLIELISTLNDEFNIEIQPTQVKPETWRNVDKIVELVKSLQQ